MQNSFLHLALTTRGGAGSAAERVHAAFGAAGHASTLVVHDAGGSDQDLQAIHSARSSAKIFLSKVYRKLTTRSNFHFTSEGFDNPDLPALLELARTASPDAIICYLTSFFLSFENILRLHNATHAPVIFFMMDMASFTGGCHYSWQCDGYRRGCGNCPALRFGAHQDDVSARVLRGKAAALGRMKSAVVGASSFLAEQARASSLFRDARVEVIPLCVSPDAYRPRNKAALRAALGVDIERPALFFGARQAELPRKGMAVLREALERLAAMPVPNGLPTLVIAGDSTDFDSLAGLGYPVRPIGLVGPGQLAEAYAAADFFVSPSLEDSGPMMINEAVMSGTPVIAFPIGVAPDLVQPGVTGEFADRLNSASLADALARALNWDGGRLAEASRAARDLALQTFTPDATVGKLVRLAAELRP